MVKNVVFTILPNCLQDQTKTGLCRCIFQKLICLVFFSEWFVVDYSSKVIKIKPSVLKVISNSGECSGFIVDKKGIVITANHVVISNDASYTSVCLYDGSKRNCCNILCKNTTYDFAILEIENDNYPALDLGEYKTIKERNNG